MFVDFSYSVAEFTLENLLKRSELLRWDFATALKFLEKLAGPLDVCKESRRLVYSCSPIGRTADMLTVPKLKQ